jgi:hypothetical protein
MLCHCVNLQRHYYDTTGTIHKGADEEFMETFAGGKYTGEPASPPTQRLKVSAPVIGHCFSYTQPELHKYFWKAMSAPSGTAFAKKLCNSSFYSVLQAANFVSKSSNPARCSAQPNLA